MPFIGRAKTLPKTIAEIIASDPWSPGSTQTWSPRVARKIHNLRRKTSQDRWERYSIQSAYDTMIASVGAELTNKREREIRRAVERVYNGKLSGGTSARTGNDWPEPDVAKTVATVDQQGAINLASYANSAKNRAGDFATYEILRRLFYDDALLCVGESFSKAEIRPLRMLANVELSRFEFIVPTQATKRVGKNQNGADSVRCLDTIGPRRFLVVEFDFAPEKDGKPTIWAEPIQHWLSQGWTPKDVSARLLNHLYVAHKREPVLIVDSGNKSVHAWYWLRDQEAEAREFMTQSAKLGADLALFVRCQWCRFPNGTRSDGRRQPVVYFRPDLLQKETALSDQTQSGDTL